ncbi:MAG: molecular chaperone TorD family protein [Tepidimonas sp.]|uniref:TorD/DmsD family molecular chaperone n=1 Tax=Tepidimonas sp. TaxID=2002775 RepID=UPI00298F21BF|nr:molecular chaperone TorD family protein [Tepidimonas sp.]MDW8335434.1 molecular chaperone TorD family protein [Tepidimonas sp.]
MAESALPFPERAGFDEETARAELYGVLAALLTAPPGDELLAALRVAVTEALARGAWLEAPWQALVAQARTLSPQQVRDEYDALFGGVGRPEVYLYASHYLSGFLNDKPLAALRDDLAALGLRRAEGVAETEDHLAVLCEVMRYLIAGDDAEVCNLARQHAFFARHLHPWVPALCDALQAHPAARFYSALAELLRTFVQVEAQAFEMA